MSKNTRTYMVIRTEYPGRVFAVAEVTGPKETASDDALAVASRRRQVYGGSWSVSDTEWTHCMIIADTGDGTPEVVYDGSVTGIGEYLVPGEYQAINPRNLRDTARTYTVTEQGTAYYTMR